MITHLQFSKKYLSIFIALGFLSLKGIAADNNTAIPPDSSLKSLDFITGKALFEKNWVPAPASTTASDGLGPLYNARSCNQCHPDGGRGSRDASLVIHINDPVYGQQLQRFSVSGFPSEARQIQVDYPVQLTSALIPPSINIAGLGWGEMNNDAISARLAPSLSGLALLEAIPESTLLALADEFDSNKDGISGRVNMVADQHEELQVGRFGWKAGQSNLRNQLARALSLDLGLGNPLAPSATGDCTVAQQSCHTLPDGNSSHHDNLEVNDVVLNLLLTYVRGLHPPRGLHSLSSTSLNTEKIEAGRQLFQRTGCEGCHVSVIRLDEGSISPYSDLLLHDMGPDLADELVEGLASGNEWRTPPLWGLGMMSADYLHDGRADSVHEAILWHGGEAAVAREAYIGLKSGERNDLILFLNSL